MKVIVKSLISKANFALGRNPRIESSGELNTEKYIPRPYDAVFILSADFELAWAWRFAKGFQNPKDAAIKRARIARTNIPKILKLCDTYNIPITWATVGHLLLEECKKDGGKPHSALKRQQYYENQYWRYEDGDWFDADPCSNWESSPEWYAPDLIRMIIRSKTAHEVACHTFSHIDCRDAVCSAEILIGELKECKKYAHEYGIELESFVHPGHMIGNLDVIEAEGFSSFRSAYDNVLGYPTKHSSGLWELKGTMELYHRKEWSVGYHIYRYNKVIERAMKHRRVCYFWFHPSMSATFIDQIMPAVFQYVAANRDRLLVTTTSNYLKMIPE